MIQHVAEVSWTDIEYLSARIPMKKYMPSAAEGTHRLTVCLIFSCPLSFTHTHTHCNEVVSVFFYLCAIVFTSWLHVFFALCLQSKREGIVCVLHISPAGFQLVTFFLPNAIHIKYAHAPFLPGLTYAPLHHVLVHFFFLDCAGVFVCMCGSQLEECADSLCGQQQGVKSEIPIWMNYSPFYVYCLCFTALSFAVLLSVEPWPLVLKTETHKFHLFVAGNSR